EIPGATEKEVTTVNLLIQTLKPYIPDKKNRFVIGYQLPFCLLANDILHITGYTKSTRSLFPTPRPTKLQALEINAPSLLYQISNKDAVFCSIFDMAQIKKSCESFNLSFAQNIKILPGMKACRVLGSKLVKKVGGAAEKEPTSYISRILNNPVVIEESKKDLSDLKQAVDTLQNKINNL
ncbi:hypothetical protein EDC94DRAFT_601022, partial [Helicostylum pulchrum]